MGKISDLTSLAAADIADDDVLPISDMTPTPTTKKVTFAAIREKLLGVLNDIADPLAGTDRFAVWDESAGVFVGVDASVLAAYLAPLVAPSVVAPVALGSVNGEGTNVDVIGGTNVAASASRPGSNLREITFTNALADANYIVVATVTGTSPYEYVGALSKATTGFQLNFTEAVGRRIDFVVFGTLAA